ncbi:MAG: hypothetical protein QOH71_2435 [Blastocatellia bacterium]|nr:hypothetical protein [Blastocatellia bacterium]
MRFGEKFCGGHVERSEGSVELEFERPLGAGNAGALARISARGERVFFEAACPWSAGEGARVPINTYLYNREISLTSRERPARPYAQDARATFKSQKFHALAKISWIRSRLNPVY